MDSIANKFPPSVGPGVEPDPNGHAGAGSSNDQPQDARILIVDDEPINIKVVQKYLRGSCYKNILTCCESPRVVELALAERPDLVILDVMMPEMDGIEVLRALRATDHARHTPVLILTASNDPDTKRRALESGATDFLAKPVDPTDLLPRVRNALLVKRHQDQLAHYSEHLEQQVQLRTAELEVSRLHVIGCLARAAEFRDDDTGKHVLRVGRTSAILARGFGYSESDADMLGLAAQLHDVGKIGIPDAILLKPGKLTPDEFDVMKRHCEIGSRIIDPSGQLQQASAQPSVLSLASMVALTHHERWDGSGYPRGLRGNDIPMSGRITAVADVFDALRSARPYKPAFDVEATLKILRDGEGTHFDPAAVRILLERLNEVLGIHARYADAA